MKQLVILGAGGFGREMLTWARQAVVPFVVKGFLDDNLRALEGFAKGVPILGRIEDYQPQSDELFVCAMGNVDSKQRCIERIRAHGGLFPRMVHSSAVVGDNVEWGEGNIVCPHAVVSSDVKLGDFVTVNLHSTVSHDSAVGRWTQLHCHVDVTGGVTLGERVTVGSHASILPGIRVGAGAVVGAGSVVTRDVAENTTVFGVPARPYLVRKAAHA